MQEHKPLYLYSREEALRHGERDQWRDSYRENCDCARAIERAIAENYRDNCLGNCAGSILDRYGFTRVNWVLANTMQQKSYDGRFSEGNKRWAKQFYIPNDDIRWHFTVESHPGLTNLFVEQVRDAWQSLGLFDASHCLPDDSDQDYTGKVVVIDPNIPKDKYKTLEDQLFLAEGGFGASPNSRGRKVYTEMIASNKEWEFAGLYADEGISGTRADKRPQFQKMIEDCHKGKIDMIITKSVSRFARNTVDCLDYVRSLKEIGVGIYFEEQNIDTLKSDSELYLVIYAGFAQSESESISKNITWTHRKNFEDGKPIFMYSRMLGYRKGEDGNPEIVPEEAAIVQRVFDMYLSGKSTDEISEILQAEKIVIPGKKLTFSKSMIIRMLKNEKYCGDAILQKTVTIDPISKKRKANEGEAPMWLVENSHPAIVTREIFNKAQEESARRKAKAPVSQKSAMTASGKYSKYALTEVMICGECGSRYKRVTWNIRGKRRIVWRCISRLDYGKKYCTESITVDEQALQRAIVRALNRFNVEDEATYLLLMKSTIGEAVGINGSSDEIDLLERRIDALNKRMLDLVSLSVQEGDDAENHEDDFKNISTQIEQLTKRITAIRESESENGDFQARLKEIQDIIDKRRENKDIYDDSIVRQMVECIKVYHDGRLQIILGGGYELEEYLEK